MALNISKALNIQEGEKGIVYLLLAQSVFLGIFAGALDVGANSLFLEAYSADLMPRAFMVSGVVGIIFTSLYARLQKRIGFKLFTILNLLIAIIFTGALRLGFSLTDDDRLAFAVLVMMGPLIIVSLLGFWGTAGRYFTLRDGKRLFGIIDTGSVVGMILAFYAVPVLVKFNFKVYDTLLIGLVSLIIAAVFQMIVLGRHKIIAPKSVEKKEKKKTGFFSIFRKRYTLMMALFVMLSVITGFFIHYSFMWATEANYPDSRELSGFLGAFFGTMMIATVVIKSTLYGWLMKNFGLKLTLIISPVLLLILTIAASFVGGFFGYAAEASSFTLFFLIIALSKLFNKSLKDAIESPSMKILYQSLDASERFDVQARIDGVVNEITAFLTGVIMAGLLMLSFVHVIHFSYLLIAILVLWLILGLALYKAYRKTLNDSLVSVKSGGFEDKGKSDSEPVYETTPMYSEAIQLNPYFNYSVSAENLTALLSSDNDRLKKYAWKSISESMFAVDSKITDSILRAGMNEEVQNIVEKYNVQHRISVKNITLAFRSNKKEELLGALNQTVVTNDRKQIPNLISLLRDKDVQVRVATIEAAGMLKLKELGGYLVDYLGHSELYEVAWASLVRMGEMVVGNLENAFHKTGVSAVVQLRIVNALITIGGEKANAFLFTKINYHQRQVREAAIEGLNRNSFIPNEKQIAILHSVILETASVGAWNIAAEYVIIENDPQNGLKEAIAAERKKMNGLLFQLLALTFDRSAIRHVQNSLEDPDNEDTGFALELMNIIVDEQVIAYLEPYFDEISVPDKVRKLQNEIAVEIIPYEDLLLEIINRDALYVGNYLKVCAIDAIGRIPEIDASTYLAAQVFHPNTVISRSAASLLSNVDRELYSELIRRKDFGFDPEEKYQGKNIIDLVERLNSWPAFSQLDREIIFELANKFLDNKEYDFTDGNLVSFMHGVGRAGAEVFSEGLVMIVPDYLGLKEMIDIAVSQPGFEVFQVDKLSFRELLFDQPELLNACHEIFKSEIINDLIVSDENNIL